MKKLLWLLCTIMIVGLAATTVSTAQTQIGVGLGYGLEIKDPCIDVRARFPISSVRALHIVPNIEYFLVDDGVTFLTLDVNANYTFLPFTGSGGVYALGGLDIAYTKVDFGTVSTSQTDLGLNLGAGLIGSVSSSMSIFGELKLVLGGSDQAVLVGGLLFNI